MFKCNKCGTSWTSSGLPLCPICGAKVAAPGAPLKEAALRDPEPHRLQVSAREASSRTAVLAPPDLEKRSATPSPVAAPGPSIARVESIPVPEPPPVSRPLAIAKDPEVMPFPPLSSVNGPLLLGFLAQATVCLLPLTILFERHRVLG